MSRLRSPALSFAVVAAVFGAAFAFVLPAFGGYDESLHFLRAWQVSEGGIFASRGSIAGEAQLGGEVPSALVDDIRQLFREGALSPGTAGATYEHLGDPTPRGPREYIGFSGAAIYSPVPYVPATGALALGRALGLSTLALLLLARLASLGAFVAIVAVAIRRLPSRRWVLAVTALAPVAIFQAATVSADTLTLALTLLVVADALHLAAARPGGARPAVVAEAVLATTALALAKQPYVVFAGLLLVPMWRHRDRLAVALGAGLAAGAGLALAWGAWARDRFVPQEVAPELGGRYAFRDVDPDAQVARLRDDPFDFAGVLARTAAEWGDEIAREVVAQVGWWRPPVPLVAVTIGLVAAAVLLGAREVPAGRTTQVAGAVLASTAGLAVCVLAYAGWNAVGAPQIDALQGRYLTPVLAVALVVVVPRLPWASAARAERAGLVLAGGSAGVLLLTVGGLARHFYL